MLLTSDKEWGHQAAPFKQMQGKYSENIDLHIYVIP